MKLGQGITTVVGPNGCGKTNIVDAIRWVLGEQKYSILRSGKMEDVIFNGAEGTKPLGVCEVAMTVHNNAGKLPIEFNDIEIARRVYRSGESEYYLNKTQCRLKDIMDLFIDTGMGSDAYSVIELKMIEQILSETADDRRKMFEEAAGIHKYRTQKKSTIRKFEATRADLERIQDIMAEVEQKVNHLELQLKRFKRHAVLTESLELKDKELAYLQIHRFYSLMKPLQNRIEEFRHLRETKSSESSKYEQDLIQLRQIYKSQESELNDLKTIMDQVDENREDLRNGVLVSAEQKRGAQLTIDRLEREKTNNFRKIESLKQLKLDFDKEVSELEPLIEEQLHIYKNKKEEFEKIDKKYKMTVEALDHIQNERWELQRKTAEDTSLYERTKELISYKEIEISELNEKISTKSKDKKLHKRNQSILEKEKNEANKLHNKSENHINTLNTKLHDLDNKRVTLLEKKHSVSGLISSLHGQKQFYNELIESKEGFPDGTRFVLENPKLFPGILGTVADMFQVDESYRDALESGLGDQSHCLIAKDRASAILALETANKKEAGNLTIIPLKEASELKSILDPIPSSKYIKARASDLVTTSKELKPLAEFLLGDLLVVEELNKVIQVSDFKAWNVVDLNGAYSGRNLIFKNRKISDDNEYVIGRKNKLELIDSELLGELGKEKALEENLKSISEMIKSIKKELNEKSIEFEDIKRITADIEMKLVREKLVQSQNVEELKKLQIRLKDSVLENKEASKALRSLDPVIKKTNQKLESSQNKVEQANKEMIDAESQKETFHNSLQEIRIKLIELESRRDQLKFKKTSGEETSDELKLRQESIKKEVESLKEKQKELESKIKSDEKELVSINAQIQKQRSIIDLKQSVYKETYQNIEELQVKISSEQSNREQILEDLKNAELEATETQQRIKLVEERIRERYNAGIPKDLIVDLSEEQLEIDIAKMQRSLENIGPVNMAVQDEYDEEVERLDILSTQCDDLVKSEENLKETIRKIDKVARKRFQETFDLIKSNFESLFRLFFEGGNANLSLIGDPDPLDADISIQAQPPGKRNTSLRLLSSGEKALTAISLLFAIYQVKPSPYCILDEVDAPLDDINIHKFTRVLGKFCDETQFIIVTHNKLTMEIADYMYGVTQEKKGVSKLVSVKFD